MVQVLMGWGIGLFGDWINGKVFMKLWKMSPACSTKCLNLNSIIVGVMILFQIRNYFHLLLIRVAKLSIPETLNFVLITGLFVIPFVSMLPGCARFGNMLLSIVAILFLLFKIWVILPYSIEEIIESGWLLILVLFGHLSMAYFALMYLWSLRLEKRTDFSAEFD